MPPCKGCQADCLWFTNEDGRPVLVDTEPVLLIEDPKGPILGYRVDGARIRGREMTKDNPLFSSRPIRVYRNHFQTCPEVHQFHRQA